MAVKRFSAIGNFGVPIDNPEALESVESLVSLLGAYDIEGEDVPVDSIDITPYYWQKPVFRYFMSRETTNGPVRIDMMPVHKDSATLTPLHQFGVPGFVIGGTRQAVIPTTQDRLMVAGPGPRFPGQFCLHEVLLDV